jgi:hypothetical protein
VWGATSYCKYQRLLWAHSQTSVSTYSNFRVPRFAWLLESVESAQRYFGLLCAWILIFAGLINPPQEFWQLDTSGTFAISPNILIIFRILWFATVISMKVKTPTWVEYTRTFALDWILNARWAQCALNGQSTWLRPCTRTQWTLIEWTHFHYSVKRFASWGHWLTPTLEWLCWLSATHTARLS